MEESEVILTNWNVLSSSSLFSHTSEFLTLPVQLSSGFLQIGSLVLQQQATLYVKSFSNVVSIAGLTGMILILTQAVSSDQCQALQNSRSLLQDHCHGESLYGCVNALQCEGVTSVLHASVSSFSDVERRLKHKDTYGHRVSELCFLLNSLTSSNTTLSPAVIVSTISDAISLYHRIDLNSCSSNRNSHVIGGLSLHISYSFLSFSLLLSSNPSTPSTLFTPTCSSSQLFCSNPPTSPPHPTTYLSYRSTRLFVHCRGLSQESFY